MRIEAATVDSSMIRSAAWVANTLFVEFTNRDVYMVPGVGRPMFTELVSAESAGKFYNQNIRNLDGIVCVLKRSKKKS